MKLISRHSYRLQKGLTLVELLVAIALQGILLIILTQLYVSDKQMSGYQTELTELQETGRYVSSQLTADIRAAGFAGCRNLDDLFPNIIANGYSGFADAADSLNLFDGGAGWIEPTGFTHKAGTDVIQLRYAGSGSYLTGNMTAENANVQVDSTPDNLEAEDIVLITDCDNADIFRATSVSNSAGKVTIAHANSSNNSNRLSKAYGDNTQIFAFRDMTYFLGSNGTDSGLYQMYSGETPILLADNVSDMEITSTTDSSGNIVGVRFGLLLFTRDNLTTVSKSYKFDGVDINTGAGADRRLRRAFWSFANVRNNTP